MGQAASPAPVKGLWESRPAGGCLLSGKSCRLLGVKSGPPYMKSTRNRGPLQDVHSIHGIFPKTSVESQGTMSIVQRGCGSCLARTFVQLRSLAQGFLQATTHLPLHILGTGSQAPAWWQLQLGGPLSASPGRTVAVPTLLLLLAWHSTAFQDPLLLWEAAPGNTIPPYSNRMGAVGRTVNHPGQTSRNDSQNLLEPVSSMPQRALPQVNTEC